MTKSWGVLIPVSSQVAFRVIWVLGGRYSVPCALQFYGLSVVMEEINIAGFVERITFSYANMLNLPCMRIHMEVAYLEYCTGSMGTAIWGLLNSAMVASAS